MPNIKPDFTERLLLDAGVCERMRILDLGCGSGDVTYILVRLVGRSGVITSSNQTSEIACVHLEVIWPFFAMSGSAEKGCISPYSS